MYTILSHVSIIKLCVMCDLISNFIVAVGLLV